MEDIAYVASGSTPSKSCFVEKGIPYLKMYNLRNQKIDFDFHPQYINEETHKGKLARSIATSGDLIMNIVGPPLGKLAIIPESIKECNFNQAAVMISPYLYKDIVNEYLYLYLSEMSEINSIITKGSAGQVNISLTQSQNMRIPLPPLTEQKRIVAEIEKRFTLIDEIEKGQTDLTTLIEQTKSKILDLAIHGKLVPQDPADEPAIDLLHRINPDFQPCDTSHYKKLPQGWCLIQIRDAAQYTNGKAFKPEEWESKGKPIIRIQNLNNSSAQYNYSTQEHEQRYLVKRGDLLFAWAASLGAYIWNGSEAWLNQHIFKVAPMPYIRKDYLYYAFNALSTNFGERCHGSGMVHITKNVFESTLLPLPPIAEQQRIVAKIETLFAAIDSISQTLTD